VLEGALSYKAQKLELSDENSWQGLKWKEIAIVFQNALSVLNPMIKVRKQIEEPLREHFDLPSQEISKRSAQVLEEVGLSSTFWEAYPHQLSGGMRQKVLIAMALICRPKLLIVDEPTMSLDPEAKKQVTTLLKRLHKKYGFSMIVISHEMNIIKSLCYEVHVLYDGWQIEKGHIDALLTMPKHPYTKGLLGSSWELDPYKDIWGIPGRIKNKCQNEVGPQECPFYRRCFQAEEKCKYYKPKTLGTVAGHEVACVKEGIEVLLEANNITKIYKVGKGKIQALNNVSLKVYGGELLAIMGKSGSGKSTLARILAGFEPMTSGKVAFHVIASDVADLCKKEGGVQLIVQDPQGAMNPYWTVGAVIEEFMDSALDITEEEKQRRIHWSFKMVQLPFEDNFFQKKVSELSGGQKQKLVIARAITMKPKLLIADEISAMLDPSGAANLIRMLRKVQIQSGMSCIYITHDIFLARKIADRVLQLDGGMVSNMGPSCLLDAFIASLSDESNYEEERITPTRSYISC